MIADQAEFTRISRRYSRFAAEEARGSSAIYEALALGIAQSPDLLAFIATLPADRRQPNLFLAAVRQIGGVPSSVAHLTEIVRDERDRIRGLMLSRTTQTNEPGRCAVLLPLLAGLAQPLALLEVGASAGLCLLPDRYGYEYGPVRIEPRRSAVGQAPVFACETRGKVPIPRAVPRIAWRAGLDLHPIDLSSPDEVSWLETLVWPGQDERAARLRDAIAIARTDPPRVVQGDLLRDLARLAAEAPQEATLVVFHTAVLTYVASPDDRARFAESVRGLPAVWISSEAPGVFPSFADHAPPPPAPGRFLLAIDGRPVAWAGAHGQSLDWFGA